MQKDTGTYCTYWTEGCSLAGQLDRVLSFKPLCIRSDECLNCIIEGMGAFTGDSSSIRKWAVLGLVLGLCVLLAAFQNCSIDELSEGFDSFTSQQLGNQRQDGEEKSSCLVEGESYPHGTDVIFYESETGDCQAQQTRRCDDSRWTGTFQYLSCTKARSAYPESQVGSEETCEKSVQQTSECQSGICGEWLPSNYSQTCSQTPYVPKKLLFVMAGQSNMVGIATLTKDIKSLYPALVPENVDYLVGTARLRDFSQSHDWIGDGLPNIGPEISLIHELSRSFPKDEITVVKVAFNGTSLKQWLPKYLDNSGAEQTTQDPLLIQALQSIDTVVAGRPLDLQAVFWMQGESDAIGFNDFGQKHKENLSRLIDEFRAHFNKPTAQFLMGRILNFSEDSPFLPIGSISGIRDQQDLVAAQKDNVQLLNLDTFRILDEWHYDGISQMSFGRCLHSTFLSKQKVVGCSKIVNPPSQKICVRGTTFTCADIPLTDGFGLWLLKTYLGHFGQERRCVDVGGLQYWRNEFTNNGKTKDDIRRAIEASPATGWGCS